MKTVQIKTSRDFIADFMEFLDTKYGVDFVDPEEFRMASAPFACDVVFPLGMATEGSVRVQARFLIQPTDD